MQARLKINDCRKSEIPLYETPGTFSCARAIHSIWNIYLHKDFINIYKREYCISLFSPFAGKIKGNAIKAQTLLPSAMGTQFCWKWGPNGDPILSEMGTYGDHCQHKWGPKKWIFKILSKRANSLQFHVQVFEYLSTKLNSTDMLAWY